MSSIKSSYTSVSQAIDDAVARYIKKESIESCLVWINEGKDRLTGWAYETEIFFGIDDYIFLTTEKELFITRDNLLEYFDADQLNLSADDDILNFIY